MAARGHLPSTFDGRPIQAPGMMRHGPFPGLGPAGHRPLEPLPPPELLENKMAVQAAEMDRLARENQRLATAHVVLRQELVATQQEMQRLHAHVGSAQTESDIQTRGLLEKIGKMDSDIRAGEIVKKELQQAHLEAQSILAARQELTAEIQNTTEELQKANADVKKMPEMHSELDQLRQEHQKLRAAFEYEKGSNIEQVEQMRAMENNLISLAREVEKLRAEVLNAEKRARVPNPYGSTYGSPDPVYPPVGQGSGYPEAGYGQSGGYRDGGFSHGGGGYTDGGFGQGGPASYSDGYGRSQVQMSGAAAGEGANPYGIASGASYLDTYGRPQVQMTGGAAVGEGMNPYGGGSGVGGYDAARGAPTSARR